MRPVERRCRRGRRTRGGVQKQAEEPDWVTAVAGAAASMYGATQARKAADAMGTAISGIDRSPFTADSSGWVVNFKGIATSSGARHAPQSALDAVTGGDLTNMQPALLALGLLAVIGLALKRRKSHG